MLHIERTLPRSARSSTTINPIHCIHAPHLEEARLLKTATQKRTFCHRRAIHSLIKKLGRKIFRSMVDVKPIHDRTDKRPLTYLIATILLVAMITLTGIFLQAELNKQTQYAKNTSSKDTAAVTKSSVTKSSKAAFRFRGLSPAKALH